MGSCLEKLSKQQGRCSGRYLAPETFSSHIPKIAQCSERQACMSTCPLHIIWMPKSQLTPHVSQAKFVIFHPIPTSRASVSSLQQLAKLSIHLLKPETQGVTQDSLYSPISHIQLPCCLNQGQIRCFRLMQQLSSIQIKYPLIMEHSPLLASLMTHSANFLPASPASSPLLYC